MGVLVCLILGGTRVGNLVRIRGTSFDHIVTLIRHVLLVSYKEKGESTGARGRR